MKTLYRQWKDDCGRKKEYASEAEAQVAADEVEAKQPGDELGVIACNWPPPTHPHWHIGHQPKPSPADMAADDRVEHRLKVIGCNPTPTPWQAAYLEDVTYLRATTPPDSRATTGTEE